jgi:hypothetical protein
MSVHFKLRDYQVDIANQITEKVKRLNICYLAAEVRCGKTLMTLEACKLLAVNRVLFLTKKKAISSIENDYKEMNYLQLIWTVHNFAESLHKVR